MEVFKGVRALNRRLSRSVVTIGNFDGVHLGHREIIRLAVEKARLLGVETVVYTFRPHPRVALQPERPFHLLTSYEEKTDLIRALNPSVLIEEPFSRDFSTTSAEMFFGDILIKSLNAETIVVGHDFGFGRKREGHLDTLTRFCEQVGVQLLIVPALKVDQQVVSSSRIREHLMKGEVVEANALLGYRFGYHGIVVKGDGRGRKLGFPTCNLRLDPKFELPLGVYATSTELSGGRAYPSVTNVGIRPTFQDDGTVSTLTVVETHILDFSEDLYGQAMSVRFCGRIREERKYPSIDALRTQITDDVKVAREILSRASA